MGRSSTAPRVPSPDSADGCVILRDWMTCMGMSTSARLVYALIYQFSEDGAGVYNGGVRYAALRCGMSERTARSAVRELMDKGYVREVGQHVNGDRLVGRSLQAPPGPADAARRDWRERFASVYAGLLRPEMVWSEIESTPAESATPAKSAGVVDGLTPAESATPAKSAGVAGKLTPANPATPAKLAGVADNVHDSISAGRRPKKQSPLQNLQGSGPQEGIDNIYINNNHYPISSNPIPKDTSLVDGEPWPGWAAMAALTASAVNRHRLNLVERAYRSLLEEGMTTDEIQAAWDSRQEDARKTVTAERFMPNLADWLESSGPTGARAMVCALRAPRRDRGDERGAQLMRIHVPGTGLCYGFSAPGGRMGPLLDEDGGMIPIADGDGHERADRALARLMGHDVA